jgi:hypothetical protein
MHDDMAQAESSAVIALPLKASRASARLAFGVAGRGGRSKPGRPN